MQSRHKKIEFHIQDWWLLIAVAALLVMVDLTMKPFFYKGYDPDWRKYATALAITAGGIQSALNRKEPGTGAWPYLLGGLLLAGVIWIPFLP